MVRRFDFRLEPILKYRIGEEETAKRAHFQAQEDYLRRNAELEKTNSVLDEVLGMENSGSLDIRDGFNIMLYRDMLVNTRDRQRKEVATAREKVVTARQIVVEARRQRLVIEKLKEKRYQEYKKEAALVEQKNMDECGQQLSIREKKDF